MLINFFIYELVLLLLIFQSTILLLLLVDVLITFNVLFLRVKRQNINKFLSFCCIFQMPRYMWVASMIGCQRHCFGNCLFKLDQWVSVIPNILTSLIIV